MKQIIVLGGGSAGWLTALFCKKIFKSNVKVIESSKIGILGAGEGATPHLIALLKELNIDPIRLTKKTKGSIKQGISFENWNGDNKKYFHGFGVKNHLNPFSVENVFDYSCYFFYLKNLVSKGYDLNKYQYPALLSYKDKIDLDNLNYSLHFDAHLLADYLKNIGIERGIKLVDGELDTLKTNKDNDIEQVKLKDGSKHKCDFIFDCTGFARLLIGKHYKTKWKSYKDYLPMKKAIPFFLEQEKQIKPYTQAIAMKYGWMWKIPLQHRFGSGYIYDSDYINEEQALNEAEKYYNKKLTSPKVISFEAGRYDKVWVNNCMAVGLSAGFTEPLEATSLYLTSQQLILIKFFYNDFFKTIEKNRDMFNDIIANNNDDVLDFLVLHYLTKRKDSKFWKEFKDKNKIPDSLKNKLDQLQNGMFYFFDFDLKRQNLNFILDSYTVVADGLKLLNNKNIKFDENLKPNIIEYKSLIDKEAAEHQTLSQFLNSSFLH